MNIESVVNSVQRLLGNGGQKVKLKLGQITFDGFEEPESIPWGGSQRLITHKLVGGDRVIDAMGPDHRDLSWSGRFRGSNAEIRARQLDYLRIQGQQQELSWAAFRYSVVISDFKADFRQTFEIPYSITCMVIKDMTVALNAAQTGSFSKVVGEDNGFLSEIASSLNYEDVTAAVSAVQDAVGIAQPFLGTSSSETLKAISAINNAQSVVNNRISSLDSVLSATSGLSSASSITSQADANANQGSLYQLKNTLGRLYKNISNAV